FSFYYAFIRKITDLASDFKNSREKKDLKAINKMKELLNQSSSNSNHDSSLCSSKLPDTSA
ncbi:hypothetical protein HK099_000804, partial [Clydaea vesicula]